ncbi:MAG: hypothetical protein KIT84_09985 [Labilithrix sp.]|nr:hypothetical protein [Labilithrix sp.]MCW5811332.1 hypothetical protein [Labilithrix sp.]
MNRALSITLSVLAVLGTEVGAGCSDPVRTAQIEALGPDTEAPNQDHRPGQPCVLCHSEGGPAESKSFAIAGTVYETRKVGSKGAPAVVVQFVDANGNKPAAIPETGPTGNFYVPIEDWPDLAFPVRVAIYDREGDPPLQVMKSLIGREPSCNFCHQPNVDPKETDDPATTIDLSRASAGQIYKTL